MISHREYLVVGFENNEDVKFRITLDELFSPNETSEAVYAIRYDVDNILTLSLGKSLYVRLSRDDNDALGVIKRIK